jgi:beta-glucosidase
VRYGEGLFVGYRWYDARGMDVTFPFGHGLSYTTFTYGKLSPAVDGDDIVATVNVTNSGKVRGREIVQAYVAVPGSAQVRVPRSLGGFASVELDAGESRDVLIRIERSELEYWDVRVDRFVVEPGRYEVSVGASSRDLRATASIDVAGEVLRIPLTLESTMGEVMANPVAAQLVAAAMPATPFSDSSGDALGMDIARMMESIPIERLVAFSGGAVTREQLGMLLAAANAS